MTDQVRYRMPHCFEVLCQLKGRDDSAWLPTASRQYGWLACSGGLVGMGGWVGGMGRVMMGWVIIGWGGMGSGYSYQKCKGGKKKGNSCKVTY